ncbi:tetratricopeptide repeat protein [Profundibacterium mesophilum]|uniref:TPR domain protein n=1 Tax=Profundibacterium mesophilum KAUST100406-0324 TaxID=1037889 RepID=A0A921TDZ1_9RHOB|nr:hypothetical protein [Profundibacterium mesophilum]KAF0676752.1 TPR domain protein [Profundibacterium mesophilum KAUST100406-0324]
MPRLPAILVLCVLPALPLAAQDCPAPQDRMDELAVLFTAIQSAPDANAAQVLSNRMWQIWATAPDARAQRLLDDGMSRRSSFDFEGAVAAFDALIAYCPDYAEGYNQRAFVAFIREDYPAALRDLDRALRRAPAHVAALSGRALTLMALGRDSAALESLRAALTLNPWLPERHLLAELEARDSL